MRNLTIHNPEFFDSLANIREIISELRYKNYPFWYSIWTLKYTNEMIPIIKQSAYIEYWLNESEKGIDI